ncbi:IDEAL domain-containing protein [Paenibacillus thermoaerophilus]|uniref:IDEAL domain-containing protein n=1 Tax=Paenibacillus thermoaerophilus TaxID=1215385 RepID=A0ABW2UZY6_9BACL|nr:IDEAL domain-containing protein [Paenibacillus thermoaerophilus]TMV08108.1 IDEAL domain-containing protein [Paenibacillus thermoaerophilus]
MGAIVRIREGDWVSGTSTQDEKLIGFVESVNDNGIVKIRVTQSDREDAVGTSVEAQSAKVKRMPDTAPSAAEELRSLIDLALATRDREWFEELSARLAALPSAAADRSAGAPSRTRPSALHRIQE